MRLFHFFGHVFLFTFMAAFSAISVGRSALAAGVTAPTTYSPLHVIHYPGQDSNPRFGTSIVMTGRHIVVGSPGDEPDDRGRVYIYDIDNLSANPTILTPPDPARNGGFGNAVAAYGDIVAISNAGADHGHVYLYDLNLGQFVGDFEPNGVITSSGRARFGSALDISANRLVVGATDEDQGATNSGAIYLFDWTTGQQLRRITETTLRQDARFGLSLDLDSDQFIVGSEKGKAHLYDAITGDLSTSFNGNAAHLFGIDVALSDSRAMVGAIWFERPGGPLDSGIIYTYNRDTGASTGTIELSPSYRSADFGRDLDTDRNLVAALAAGSEFSPDDGFIFDSVTGELVAVLDPGIELFDGDIFLNNQYALISNSTGTGTGMSVYLFQVPEPASMSMFAGLLLFTAARSSPCRRLRRCGR